MMEREKDLYRPTRIIARRRQGLALGRPFCETGASYEGFPFARPGGGREGGLTPSR
jgi:hypothetical protein